MNYRQAVRNFKEDPSNENLENLTDLLVSSMTLKEKINLTSGIPILPFMARLIYGVARGSFLYMPFVGGGCKRLGIPRIVFSDGPRGSVIKRNTCFPVASLRSATFDDELEYKVGGMIADELIAGGANFFGGVCVNIVRNPRWGRAQESYGEDPYLLGRMGSAITRAMQDKGVIACVKHFALNSIENYRFQVSANADERALREIYLPHFKKCIEAGALSVMSAYNKVNDKYCGENKYLLTEILRNDWNFDGFVMSDFMWGVHDCKESYEAGLDMEMPTRTHHKKASKLIKQGEMDQSHIDRAASNILRVLIKQTPKIIPRKKSVAKCQAHLDLARELATKGTVLLKNNGVLPIPASKSLAVVGSFADTVNTGDNGSSFIWSKDGITPYEGLRNVYNHVSLYNGCEITQALNTAKDADVVVVCVGSDRLREGELVVNNVENLEKSPDKKVGGDRANLQLSDAEIELIKALKNSGKKVVVTLSTGSVYLTSQFSDYTDAILLTFYGGVQAGNALADIISGKVNPSGKLPITIACKEEDYPEFFEIGQRPFEINYGYYLGYMLFDKMNNPVEYPFGFGLSYTKFEVASTQVQLEKQNIVIEVIIQNTGEIDGEEVVQVYVGSMDGDKDRPIKMLKGFKRVFVRAREQEKVEIHIPLEDLRFYSPESKTWELDSKYKIFIGTDSLNAARITRDIEVLPN